MGKMEGIKQFWRSKRKWSLECQEKRGARASAPKIVKVLAYRRRSRQ